MSLSRRSFLERSWLVAAALATGETSFLSLHYLGSRKTETPSGEIITAGDMSEFPPDTLTLFVTAHFYLVRLSDGGFLALHTRCTHLACTVSWNETEKKFICPCHGSQFGKQGDVINPPAPQPLDIFPVIFEGTTIKVDTRTVIPRHKISADDIAYPEPSEGDNQ